jgi:hypothetical protein
MIEGRVWMPVAELGPVLLELLGRAGVASAAGGGAVVPVVRYLRRKPGQSLRVVYDIRPAGRRPAPPGGAGMGDRPGGLPASKAWPWRSRQMLTAIVAPASLVPGGVGFDAEEARCAPLEVGRDGVIRVGALGLAVQPFPADAGLPGLAGALDVTPSGRLWVHLAGAAGTLLGEGEVRVAGMRAVPLRYEVGRRCVIVYRLVLEDGTAVAVCGKLYADPAQARAVDALLCALHRDAGDAEPPVPRSLGVVDELGLLLTEMVRPAEVGDRLAPRYHRAPDGRPIESAVPTSELRQAAWLLARLHTTAVALRVAPPHTGRDEAATVRERAARLPGVDPAGAALVLPYAERVVGLLEALPPVRLRPAHGRFKPEQLVHPGGRSVVVDLDAFGLADPALDLGTFLVHLRPGGFWYGRPAARRWFEAAAAALLGGYREAMRAAGVGPAEVDGILARVPLYEAGRLFRLAIRRVSRGNAPRHGELAAICAEVGRLLSSCSPTVGACRDGRRPSPG